MKKIIVTGVFFTSLFLSSCTDKSNKNEENEDVSKAITEYCNCVEEKLNDSLIDIKLTDAYKTDCFKSIVDKKYHLAKEKELTENFDSTKLIVKLNKSISKKIEENLSNLLVSSKWTKYNSELIVDFIRFEKRILSFDGVICTLDLYRDSNYGFSLELKNSWSGKYSIVKEKNGETYVYVDYGVESRVYKLGKNSKNQSYLEDGSNIFWKD